MEREQLKSVLEGIRYNQNRLAFLFYWLEDINYHTEEKEVAAMFTANEKNTENDMAALYLVATRALFEAKHWDSIKEHLHETYNEEQLAEYIEKLRKGESVAMTGLVSTKCFMDYCRARNLASTCGNITGYGTNLEMDDIKKILAEINEEERRQALAYATD